MTEHRFKDRADAGRHLAIRLAAEELPPDTLILGLPRGGVVVAAEVADVLGLPFDVLTVRKLGVPGQEELAMGALATGGGLVLNIPLIEKLHIDSDTLDRVMEEERLELDRRERMFRDGRPAPEVANRTVILVDDGLATGATMQAAIRAVRQHHPLRVVAAAPVGADDTCATLSFEADVICLLRPANFRAVGAWYEDFRQTTDDDVLRLLAGQGRNPVR